MTPADIECFYDDLVKRVDRNTAYLRIRGLKKFFAGIRRILPFYTSPFEIMSEKLEGKLNRTRKGNRTKKALSVVEIRRLLAWLKDNDFVNYAPVFMLVTSGLRASELCSLRWRDLEYHEGKWTARFTGKGGTAAEQELYGPAVEATRAAFGREPRQDEPLYYSGRRTAMEYHVLWDRVRKMGACVRAAGVVTRELVWSPHLFRRSYATALYRTGMKVKAIQNLTRHASLDVLVKHYIHDDEPATPYIERMLG